MQPKISEREQKYSIKDHDKPARRYFIWLKLSFSCVFGKRGLTYKGLAPRAFNLSLS